MDLENEEKRLKFEKKNIVLFTIITGSSTLGIIAGGKGIFDNAFTEASPEGLLKIVISGGILILSTKALALGIQGYNLSRDRKKQIEENIKTLKK